MSTFWDHRGVGIGADGEKPSEVSGSSKACGVSAKGGPSGTIQSTGHVRRRRAVSALVTSLILLLFTNTASTCHASTVVARKLLHHARETTTTLLEVFQVYPPVLTVTPDGVLEITDGSSNATVDIIDPHRPTCQTTLAIHSFAYSYGDPFVGNYTPPSCDFNRVTWNLTVTSAGRQYDRLGIVYLGDIEVFRTSTAEPTTNGIEWTYLKDMTSYLALFKQDQKIIFDLGNIVNDVYTASFNVTLTAAFFNGVDSVVPADAILPVSARLAAQNQPSVFTVPSDVASNVLSLPQNIKKAVFTIAATGQSQEEFWWSNVLQSDVNTFPQYGLLYGYSPFREIQLFIDDALAGVAWPFPIIFTGGIVPGLWRPIVGIDAFDLKEDEIDITPWLPLLCDGNAHNFTIRISGLNNYGNGSATLSATTDSYWLVTGKIFIWLDEPGHVTTGSTPFVVADAPKFQVSSSIGTGLNGTNETLYYEVNAQRTISVESTVRTSTGNKSASWRQSLSFSNVGNFTDGGNVEVNTQQTTGYDKSSDGYGRHISYPLYAYSVYATTGENISYVANVDRGKDVQTIGRSVFPTGLESFAAAEDVHPEYEVFQGASLSTTQTGQATYLQNTTTLASFSFGSTEQYMIFSGINVDAQDQANKFPEVSKSRELFERHVEAVNGTVIEDEETLVNEEVRHVHGAPRSANGFVISNVSGRGGNWHRLKRRRSV